jgi:DUF1680 family protein
MSVEIPTDRSSERRIPSMAAAVSPIIAACLPLPSNQVTLTEGLLADWQERNRNSTIGHSISELRKAGNLENLMSAAEGSLVEYRGKYPFLDTDVYKTLEGLVYELARPELSENISPARSFYEEAVLLIEAAQQADGYLNSYYQNPHNRTEPWSDLAWGHEMYNLGHLTQCAVSANRQLGDDRLLKVACAFADLVVEKFGADGAAEVCGHPEVEMALVELYRETGRPCYLDQARLFVDRRGTGSVKLSNFTAEYFQDNYPLRELPSVTGHAVRMMYLAAGAADVASETHDAGLIQALDRLWDDMVASKLYLTGGLGSRHSDEAIGDRYELPSERSYSETCAAIGTMQWAWRMFLATGEAKFIDVYETVLYNAYAVGLSADGTHFFYDNPLQRRADHEQRSGAESGGELLRRPWFGCPCCPPNVIRWMSSLQDYIAVTIEDGLKIANYGSAEINTAQLSVTMTTDYPWDGRVRLTVTAAPSEKDMKKADRTLSLRIPAWTQHASVVINGETVSDAPRKGWLDLTRSWVVGDEILLDLPMNARAHASHPYLDATRGSIAVMRGPLVYCAEQQDSPSNVDDLVVDVRDVEAAVASPAVLLGTVPYTALSLPVRVDTPLSAALYPVVRAGKTAADENAQAGVSQASHSRTPLVPYFLWGNREPGPMRVWLRNF